MRRYRQPEAASEGAWHVIRAVILWTVLAALVVAGGAAGAGYLYAHRFVAAVAPHSAQDKAAAEAADVAIPGQPTTALLIGTDKRKGIEAELTGRSDTLMLVRADPQTKTLSLLSFPRDLSVTVKCPGRPDSRDRINAAYSQCGALGSLQTVRSLTGLPINYFITVNFRGFMELVNNLGGVWVDVDRRYLCNEPKLPRRDADRPAAGLPAAACNPGARIRALPPTRQRPVSRRAPAAVPEGAQAADHELARPRHAARHHRRGRRRTSSRRPRRQQADRPADDQGLRATSRARSHRVTSSRRRSTASPATPSFRRRPRTSLRRSGLRPTRTSSAPDKATSRRARHQAHARPRRARVTSRSPF